MPEPPPSLRCPQCGAPAAAVEDDPFLACPFCGARVFLDAAGAVRHFIVEPRLDAPSAAAALARWLKGREVVGGIAPAGTELIFFPVWQATLRGKVHVVPAAGALFEGLDRLEVPAGDQKVFAASRARGPKGEPARLVEASVPLQAALARAQGRASGMRDPRIAEGAAADAAGAAGALPPGAEVRLVHVPLHVIRYDYQGTTYAAAVEGSTGQVHPITAPRSSESRIDLAFAALLAAGLVLNLAALSLFRAAPAVSVVLLGAVSWGLYAAGTRLARWMES